VKRRSALAALAIAAIPCGGLSQPATKHARLGLILSEIPPLTDPFFAALADRGWSRGNNLDVQIRATAREQPRAEGFVRELIERRVDILVTVGTANAVAARRATSQVPIVMLAAGYPVESGLAASLARPGGNVTGLSVYAGRELFGKYVTLLKEMVPQLRELGIFWGYAPPAFPEVETKLAVGEMLHAADALGINVRVWLNPDEKALARSMSEAARVHLDAIFVSAGGAQSVPEAIAKLAEFAASRRLPVACDVAGNFFMAGGLIAYSVVWHELGLRGAAFVDRILRGAKAAELPIEQPTRFELVVNARRAKAIGMKLPASVLLRADRVIE
jgi:putative tryptophan/tyrosine transport system substrate-binding protein